MLIGLMLIINTGHQRRQNVIITANMRISEPFKLNKGVQVVKLFHGKPYSTVLAVDRCSKYVYETVSSEAERNDPGDTSILADEYEVKKLGKACTRKNTVSESHLSGLPWFLPIFLHCEDRMVRNQQEREEYHCDLLDPIANGEESGKLYPATEPDCCTLLLEKEARIEARKRFKKLHAAFAILTKRQAEVIKLLYFSKPKTTEREVAKALGLNQSTVHRTACAALRKLRESF